MAPEDTERSAWLFVRPLPQTDKAQTACKHHGHQWQSNLSTRPSRTLRLAKEGCFRTSQQLQQCAAALPFALTIYVACPAPCSFDVRNVKPYPLRTPDGRRFSKPLPALVLPPGLRHRPCTGTIHINSKSAYMVRLFNRHAYIERVHERICRTCHVIQLHIDGAVTHIDQLQKFTAALYTASMASAGMQQLSHPLYSVVLLPALIALKPKRCCVEGFHNAFFVSAKTFM